MTVPATGEQTELHHGPFRAVVVEFGGGLRRLTVDGVPLVDGYAAHEVAPFSRGELLAPWPNRLGDGRYTFAGATYQVPLDEPERRTALHGLARWGTWRVVDRGRDRTGDQVSLAHRLFPRPGYPFLLDLRVDYRLDDAGLTVTQSARNLGATAAPYGTGAHPYLTAGTPRVDSCRFTLPAARRLRVTPDRLLPVGLADVAGTRFDFREGPPIGDLAVDHAFTGLARDATGTARATLVDPATGRGVTLWWDTAFPWVQVHTADRPEPRYHRVALAVEPMTCPPDALRSGVDLVVLAPGEAHAGRWGIRPAGPG